MSFDAEGGMLIEMAPLYYAKVMIQSGKAPEGYENLMKSLKLYSDAAIAYAEGKTN